jgi:hypothetical protein
MVWRQRPGRAPARRSRGRPVSLVNHVAAVLGLASGAALTVKASAKPICGMIVALVTVFRVDKSKVADALKQLPKP